MGKQRFTVSRRLRSFKFAFAGLKYVFTTQHNFWIHVAASFAVIAAALTLKISNADWRWLITAMALVLVAETLNTAIELACDAITPEFNGYIQKSKDIAAGAVFIAATAAAMIGVLVFWPYLT